MAMHWSMVAFALVVAAAAANGLPSGLDLEPLDKQSDLGAEASEITEEFRSNLEDLAQRQAEEMAQFLYWIWQLSRSQVGKRVSYRDLLASRHQRNAPEQQWSKNLGNLPAGHNIGSLRRMRSQTETAAGAEGGFDTSGLRPFGGTIEPLEFAYRSRAFFPTFPKRSMTTDSKQIRFHQCYFNPISCFKR